MSGPLGSFLKGAKVVFFNVQRWTVLSVPSRSSTLTLCRREIEAQGDAQCLRGGATASRQPDALTCPSASFPRFIFPTTRLGPESQFSDFLDGLGPAQIVGRQTLATPPMGESS